METLFDQLVAGFLLLSVCIGLVAGVVAGFRWMFAPQEDTESFDELLRQRRERETASWNAGMSALRQEWRGFFDEADRQRARNANASAGFATVTVNSDPAWRAVHDDDDPVNQTWSGNGHDTFLDTGMHGFGTHFDHD